MKLSRVGELSLLETIRKRFSVKTPGLLLGIGDDAAVVKPKNANMLLTTDMMVEGVHFDLAWSTPFQIGFKLVSVNVSDIYAMGGMPRFLLLNFAAQGSFDMSMFNELFDGIGKAAGEYGVSLIGGDISAADKLVLSATAVGYASKPLRRSGARVGDLIYVTGSLGDSAAGLSLLKRINKKVEIEKGKKTQSDLPWDVSGPLLRRHLMPVAVRPGRFRARATSMIDVSDGLLIDLSRICRESGVGATLYRERIPVSRELTAAAAYLGEDPMELALEGGEDYELLFTAPGERKMPAFCIGEITGQGMKIVDRGGKTNKLSVKGYQHFEA